MSPSSKKEITALEKVFKKYNIRNEYYLTLPIASWNDILLRGNIDKNILNSTLTKSRYFMDEETESWRRLWNYRELEDDEFKDYLKKVVTNFDNNKYKEQGKLLHVIALLLFFSKFKMYEKTQKNIIKQAKENIRSCIKSEKWDTIEYDRSFGGGAYNLSFYGGESNNMQEVLKYFEREIETSFSKQLKDKANALLEDFKENNLENIEKKLQQEFYAIPILSQININDFVLMLQNLEHKNIYDIEQKIKKRYSNAYNLENILSEQRFWKSVNNRILKGIDISDNPVKYDLLKSFKEYTIKEILQNFQKQRKRLEMNKTQNNRN